MQVQVHADSSVKSNAILAQAVEETVGNAVRRWTPRITRVEVHLSDINGQKGGADDKRCLLEARIAGLQPIAVTHQAGTLHDAIAAVKAGFTSTWGNFPAEGIVARPKTELNTSDGNRIITKIKCRDFITNPVRR